jgi:hypothetical protein
MSTDIDLDATEAIGADLDRAARALDGVGGSAPRAVDAGIYSSLVMSVLSRVTEGAAGLAEGTADAGAGVRDVVETYRHTDAGSSQRLTGLRPGMP